MSTSVQALVKVTAPAVDELIQAARDPSQDAALAGRLAVKAYRLTPYGTDDPRRPGVYNALWFALNRLDANAARALIEPVAKASGQGRDDPKRAHRAEDLHARHAGIHTDGAEQVPAGESAVHGEVAVLTA